MDDALQTLQATLQQLKKPPAQEKNSIFFKTKPGDYAAHDQFLGITVPVLRKLANQYHFLSLTSLTSLLSSPFNEERLLALFILIAQYEQGNERLKQDIYRLYRQYTPHINNWNLVDASAHWIVGAHLYQGDRSPLVLLATSKNLWERRISIVSTWYFIRHHDFEWTIKIASLLLQDKHDLIHKATGWMLREVGKRDRKVLLDFLDQHARTMPRTMLRYAIEHLSPEERKGYLSLS